MYAPVTPTLVVVVGGIKKILRAFWSTGLAETAVADSIRDLVLRQYGGQ